MREERRPGERRDGWSADRELRLPTEVGASGIWELTPSFKTPQSFPPLSKSSRGAS